MKKKKKINRFLLRRIIAIVAVLLIILAFRRFCYWIWSQQEIKQTRLLLDNEMIGLSNPIMIEDSVVYVSEEDVKTIFDDTIYYNRGDKELITTYNKHVAVLHLNETQMIVNDSIVQMQGNLKEIDSKVYLPISDLGIVYDLEIEYATTTNLVIANSITKAKKQAMLLKNSHIKKSKWPFALTIETLKRGDFVFVLEENGRYQKVRTSLGKIGYIKIRKTSDVEILREDLLEEIDQINYLEGYSEIRNYDEKPDLVADQENVVIIDDFVLEKEAKIKSQVDVHSENYQPYVQWTEMNEIGMIANLKSETSIAETLATYEQRNKVINEIYQKLMEKQYKGICIEFEKIDDVNNFYRLLIEMTPKLKESGLKVVVKLNQQMDKEKVKSIVDFSFETNKG